MTTPSEHSADTLNTRIGDLADAVERLIDVQRRLARRGIITVLVIAAVLIGGGWYQAHKDRAQSCKNQNATRQVVRDLLISARDATPESQRTPEGDEFYDTQLSKVKRLDC